MIKLLKCLFITGLLFGSISCKKDKQTFEASGTLEYTGDVAYDGCDWLIKINSEYYHPENLTEENKLNHAKISVSYQLLSNRFHCGFGVGPGLRIMRIKKLTIN
jgi:hypothetical protein